MYKQEALRGCKAKTVGKLPAGKEVLQDLNKRIKMDEYRVSDFSSKVENCSDKFGIPIETEYSYSFVLKKPQQLIKEEE